MTIASVIHANANLRALRQNYPEIERLGNASTSVPNPVTVAPQVPKAITLKAIMALVPAAEMVKCYQLPGFIDDVRRAIDSDDREYMGILIQIAAATGASIFAAAGLGYVTAAQIQGVDNELHLGGNW